MHYKCADSATRTFGHESYNTSRRWLIAAVQSLHKTAQLSSACNLKWHATVEKVSPLSSFLVVQRSSVGLYSVGGASDQIYLTTLSCTQQGCSDDLTHKCVRTLPWREGGTMVSHASTVVHSCILGVLHLTLIQVFAVRASASTKMVLHHLGTRLQPRLYDVWYEPLGMLASHFDHKKAPLFQCGPSVTAVTRVQA